MLDKNCIHYEVCSYYGGAYETCDKCKFRKYGIANTNRHVEVAGVCIEHEWAEEENGKLISNFECPFCGEWHRQEEIDAFCSHCGNPIMIVYKERKR